MLFVGRVSPEKGVHTLIDAVVALAADDDRVKLTLVGPHSVLPAEAVVRGFDRPPSRDLGRWYGGPPYRAQLEQRIPAGLQSRVDWAGVVPYQDLPVRYAAASVLVNPSLSESFGMTVVEAMASGRPVIATRVGGQEYLVADGTSGLLVEPEDPAELADAILQIRRRPGTRPPHGRSRQAAGTGVRLGQGHRATLDLYSNLIPTRSPN